LTAARDLLPPPGGLVVNQTLCPRACAPAQVVLNRRWAYRELFDSEEDAARAYDAAIWRLRPRDARTYVNFKDTCPGDVSDMLRRATKVRARGAAGEHVSALEACRWQRPGAAWRPADA
jgi:hypothetical protein